MDTQQPTELLRPLCQRIHSKRKVFFWVIPTTLVISFLFAFSIPKYYECTVILAPESQNANFGTLSSLMSDLGINISNLEVKDAISPALYPDIVHSTQFLNELLETPVKTIDGHFSGSYLAYVSTQQKTPFWKMPIAWIKRSTPSKNTTSTVGNNSDVQQEPTSSLWIAKSHLSGIESLRNNIECTVEKKTNVITITMKAQDKFVAATMADAVQQQLQLFITRYRTQKAQTDVNYYSDLLTVSRQQYDQACETYLSYMEEHATDHYAQHKIQSTNLENDMNLKYAAYSSLQKQLMSAQAKLQENTPVFTQIQSACIPSGAAGPHRLAMVIIFTFLVTFCVGLCVCWHEIIRYIQA